MAWYAIRIKPHKEELARANYHNQGLVVYLPQMRCRVRHARRVKEVLRPVFPGYLFLELDPECCDWTAVSSTRGVLGPVRFGDHYPPVPDWVIESLRAKEDEQRLITPGSFHRPHLQPGCEVEVEMDGPEPVKGFFCNFNGRDNVEVLLDLLQRQVRAKVPLDRVRPLKRLPENP